MGSGFEPSDPSQTENYQGVNVVGGEQTIFHAGVVEMP